MGDSDDATSNAVPQEKDFAAAHRDTLNVTQTVHPSQKLPLTRVNNKHCSTGPRHKVAAVQDMNLAEIDFLDFSRGVVADGVGEHSDHWGVTMEKVAEHVGRFHLTLNV